MTSQSPDAPSIALFAMGGIRKRSRLLCLAALIALSTPAHAQGCAQCLDNTRATPPAVQKAYRQAIFLLAGAASTLFIAGTLLLRRR